MDAGHSSARHREAPFQVMSLFSSLEWEQQRKHGLHREVGGEILLYYRDYSINVLGASGRMGRTTRFVSCGFVRLHALTTQTPEATILELVNWPWFACEATKPPPPRHSILNMPGTRWLLISFNKRRLLRSIYSRH